MKARILFLLTLPLISLTGCNNYSTTELSLDNYLTYFESFDSKKESVAKWNENKNNCVAPKGEILNMNAMFKVRDDKMDNSYYSNVKFQFAIDCYYERTSITESDVPNKTINFTSALHWENVKNGNDKSEYCYVGFLILGMGYTMYYYAENDAELTTYEIDFLKEDITNNLLDNKAESSYYREIRLVSVSGKVETGGLANLNDHHCD